MKKKITKIAIFDFDGTIADTPLQEEGIKVFEQKTGKKWPHKGWWSKHETLDTEIFDIPLIKSVKEAYDKVKDEDETLRVMLTGRLPFLSKKVEAILDGHGLEFDEHHYNTGGKTEDSKMRTMESLLLKFPDVERIEIWDDRLEHIPIFHDFLHEKVRLGIIKSFNITVVPADRHK
jgi:hypothetical protein